MNLFEILTLSILGASFLVVLSLAIITVVKTKKVDAANAEEVRKAKKLKRYFTTFEIIWFVAVTIATIVLAVIYPE